MTVVNFCSPTQPHPQEYTGCRFSSWGPWLNFLVYCDHWATSTVSPTSCTMRFWCSFAWTLLWISSPLRVAPTPTWSLPFWLLNKEFLCGCPNECLKSFCGVSIYYNSTCEKLFNTPNVCNSSNKVEFSLNGEGQSSNILWKRRN